MSKNDQNQNQKQLGQENIQTQERHYRLKNGQMIPETEYQRRVREYRELSLENISSNKVYDSQVMLEAKYLSAQKTLQSPERETEQLRALLDSSMTLHRHFIAWEDNYAKDMAWKRSIEAGLRNFMAEQTNLLQLIETKLDEQLNGNPESQGGMLNLVMGTLNDLRIRLERVEMSSNSRQLVRPKQPE